MAKRDEEIVVATIDEALEQTHFGRFNYIIILFSGLILFNVVLESVGISFVLPILECDLHLNSQQQGVMGAVSFMGIIASSHLWGFLADTTGRRNIMRPALMSQFVITIVSTFSTNFMMLAITRFLNGILLSATSATVYAYLGEFHCQKYRNRAILSAAFISAFSSIFFPVIAWIFMSLSWEFYIPYINIVFKSWRIYMLACGVPGFICCLWLFKLPESPKYLLSTGRAAEAVTVLQTIHRINSRANTKLECSSFKITHLLPDVATPTKKLKEAADYVDKKPPLFALFHLMWKQTAPLFGSKHVRKTLLASIIQFIIFFTAHGVYMWFPYILNSAMQFTQRHSTPMCLCDILKFTRNANFSTTGVEGSEEPVCVTHLEISTYQHTIILELIYVVLLLCVSFSIGKFGRTPMLVIILLVCGSCGILGLALKIPLLGIYCFVVLLCCGVGTTVVNAIVVDIYPTNLRAMAVCISMMLGRIGSVTGSNVLGALIDSNCEAALYSAASSLIFAAFLGFLLPKVSAEQVKPSQTEKIVERC